MTDNQTDTIGFSISQYKLWLQRRRSARTIDKYSYIVSNFLQYVNGEFGINDVRLLDYIHVDRFLLMHQAKNKPNTICMYYHALKSFYKYLGKVALFDQIERPMHEQVVDKRVNRIDVINVLFANATEQVDKVILSVLYDTGIRVSELCMLNIEDFSVDSKTLEVSILKKRSPHKKVKSLDEITVQYIRDFIESRLDSEKALIINKAGKRATPNHIRYRIHMLCNKAQIEFVNPHSIRHGRGTDIGASGATPVMIKEFFDHSTIDMSMSYVHLDENDLKKMIPHAFTKATKAEEE